MGDFIVLSWKPFDTSRKATAKRFDSSEKALEYVADLKKRVCDVVIVEDMGKSKDGNDIYKIKNYGYYKVYSTINVLLGTLFISLPIFCYLYFVYFK
jgi:hypothetical protein